MTHTTHAANSSRTTLATIAVAIATAFSLFVSIAPPAGAGQKSEDKAAAVVQEAGAASERAAAALERFVVRADDGTLSFARGASAKSAHVPQDAFDNISASMGVLNSLVREGKLVTTPDLSVYAVEGAYSTQSVGSAWYWRWWGVEIHLSAYWTNKVINAMNVGAGIAGITAVLCSATGVCGVVAGIAAGLLAIGSGVVGWCSNSRGVVLKRNHLGPVWCHGH